MSSTIQLVESMALLATVDPDDVATTAVTSDWVDMSKFGQIIAVVQAGVLSGTLDGKLQEATSSSGTGNVDLTGKTITQLSATDDDKQGLINCRAEELSAGFTHVALVITPTGGSANFASGVILGGNAYHKPASDSDLTTVNSITN